MFSVKDLGTLTRLRHSRESICKDFSASGLLYQAKRKKKKSRNQDELGLLRLLGSQNVHSLPTPSPF